MRNIFIKNVNIKQIIQNNIFFLLMFHYLNLHLLFCFSIYVNHKEDYVNAIHLLNYTYFFYELYNYYHISI